MKQGIIIAALPAELRPLVRGWEHVRREGSDIWRRPAPSGAGWRWTAACAGIGRAAALRALAAAQAEAGRADRLISAGFAGALVGELSAGRVYSSAQVVDSTNGVIFDNAMERSGACLAEALPLLRLVTVDRVFGPPGKALLRDRMGAHLVDMEAAALAAVARARKIPFTCLKGISDTPRDRLPSNPSFISREGRLRYGPLILHAIIRPWLWIGYARLAQNSSSAARGLKTALLAVMDDAS